MRRAVAIQGAAQVNDQLSSGLSVGHLARAKYAKPVVESLPEGGVVESDGDRDPLSLVGGLVNGRYSVSRLIGRGGMGFVYEAVEQGIERTCALKFIQLHGVRDRDALLQRFFREAKIQSSLRSGGVVEVYGLDNWQDPRVPESPGTPFLVMELLDGESLGHRLQMRHTLEWQEAFQIVVRACEPLALAHGMGVVHRDLKPDNLFLPRAGGVKVLDFGIAHFNDISRITKTGQMLGTPFYMSPEQARTPKKVDVRADVYALGVVLYRAVTARLPFEGAQTLTELIKRMLLDSPTDVKLLAPSLPDNAAAVIRKAMAKERDERFASVAALAKALTGCVAGEGYALRATPGEKTLDASPDVTNAKTHQERQAVPVPVAILQESSVQPVIVERPQQAARPRWAIVAVGAAVTVMAIGAAVAIGRQSPKPIPPAVAKVAPSAPIPVAAIEPPRASPPPVADTPQPAARAQQKRVRTTRRSTPKDDALVDPFRAK